MVPPLRLVFVIAAVGAAPIAGDTAPHAYTLAVGRIAVTSERCTFTLGAGARLTLHADGVPCLRMRELIGRTQRLVIHMDQGDVDADGAP